MGAKLPGRFKTRRPTCKCDICGSNFLNIQALRSHQACVHPRTKRVAYKPKTEVIARRKIIPVKKGLKTGTVKAKAAQIAQKAVVKSASERVGKSSDDKRYNTRRTEFECPVCAKIFTVYFSAYRHIQKHHCVNEAGEAVAPNSSDLIKPTRVELCLSCNKRVISNQPHSCTPSCSISEVCHSNCYTCLGCEQTFVSVHLFDVHIPGLHSDGVESLFFPDKETFSAWQDDMEVQAEMKYMMLNKRDNYRVEHCSYVRTDDKTAWFCPASFSVQEFTKGIQVAFYKEHFGHEAKPYTLPDKFKKHVMSTIMKKTEATYTVTKPRASEAEVTQFQNLMNGILKMASRVDVDELKSLISKALEMSTIVRKYEVMDKIAELEKEDEANKLDKCLKKRKLEADITIAKKMKTGTPIDDSDDVPEVNKTIIKTYVNVKRLNPPEEKKSSKEQPSPSSFNDSYKNFVDASYKLTDEPKSKKFEVKKEKKEIVKTKIGQFKRIPSPNKTVTPKVKPDFEYEVREQDNDCNILVIKI